MKKIIIITILIFSNIVFSQGKIYQSQDYQRLSIINAKLNPKTTAQISAMTMTINDKGYIVYDINLEKFQFWTGTAWSTLSTTIGANPTATVGLTANNGTATTFMRSDATPQLSQAIVPTWTGQHTFSVAPKFTSFTTGSIPFIGASGLLSQNNTNLFWDNTNFRLGIGTPTPQNDLHIKKSKTGEVGITVENTNITASDYTDVATLNGDVKTTIGSYKAGGYGYTGTESNHDFYIYANNNTSLVMKPTGRIGIGLTTATNNPTNTLFIGSINGSGLSFENLKTTSSIVTNSVLIGVTPTGEVVRTPVLLSKTTTNITATPIQYINGNLRISQSNGVILTSPNNTKFKLSITNNGELLIEPVN